MSYFPETGSPVFGEGSSHGSPSHPFRGDDADVGEFSLDPEPHADGPYMDFELANMEVPELLSEIDQNLIGDLKEGAPDVLKALMKQEPGYMEFSPSSRTEELGRATAFIDDSGVSHQSGFNAAAVSKNEDMLEEAEPNYLRNDAIAPGASRKTLSNASNTAQGTESAENSEGVNVNGGAKKKAIRAERNRQSAAASRERKKHHIRELERRVSMLSMENATLQVEQFNKIRARIEEEKRLADENQRLKNQLEFLDSKIEKASKHLREAGVDAETKPESENSKTWGPGDFSGVKKK
mmetsp:Transcript_21179/g.86493  ORF Transcript_21179/g.86493 Transcript_21179/m.86493 type:complete len:295 (-) Transcript_21179:3562-4446(-)|eukprot:CAMPEP_0113970898 /NCGR_PEP_ID=MMETSP0011_2-20120614/11687_1 /TAXON_ID=101924 /ORGANISM="Rhodosorus marinus" /LENGTH=294 /DNA_ID=CAMNT_0000985835 /DNA_START=223 /DNA_END=1107 /DNA_ORIENTATION=+ /assembly_acc=CAM_ASM_000156